MTTHAPLTCWRCQQEPDGDEAACAWCGVWLVDLDPGRVPAPLRGLLGPAQRWGISDGGYRVAAVAAATRGELRAMVHAFEDVDIEQVDAWLCRPESHAQGPSHEYVAVSALTMAADRAKRQLEAP